MAPSFWQILIVLVLVLLLFGRGKIAGLMGEMATGIKSIKRGMAESDKKVEDASGNVIDAEPTAATAGVNEGTDEKEKASNGKPGQAHGAAWSAKLHINYYV